MRRWQFFFRKARLEKELDSELRFHLDSVVQEKMATGSSPEEARRLALLEFGGAEQIKEECRDTHRLALVESTVAHGKSAFRFLQKSPGFSAAVIVTLALGMGANSAVFSALDTILLRPLPYPESSQLVVLHQYNRNEKNPIRPLAPVRLEDWNRDNSTFQAIAGSYTQDLSETSGELPERLAEADVTPRFLQVLGVAPELGRDFTSAEEHFGGPKAVLISDRFWKRRFHADPGVIGKRMLESVAALPGVTSATISAMVPGTARGFPLEIKVADDVAHPERKITADEKIVYGAYFETLRIPLLAGSTCRTNTLWTTAVINHSFAETYFAHQAALGHHLEISAYDAKPEIIGVVADARENGFEHPPLPTVYWCSSNANPSPYFLLRTHGDPMRLAGVLTRKLHQIEPNRSVFEVMPLAQHLSESNAESRFRVFLLTLFALTALSLAVIGLYGTLSYLVVLRHREIGLRLALGALPGQIRTSFLAQGTSISLLGCLAGLAIAAALSRLLETMLYGISRFDPVTYLGVAVGVLVVAVGSSVVPALRAARLDPMVTLRQE